MKLPLRHLTAVAALALLLPACLIHSESSSSHSGSYVSDETLARITPGKDTEYVLALLGDPDRRTALKDGSEIWRWSYSEETESEGAVFLLLSTESRKERERAVFVELADGRVVKAWRD